MLFLLTKQYRRAGPFSVGPSLVHIIIVIGGCYDSFCLFFASGTS
nr:MAG TPA: hypothetical protein [Caudoviricetes sp.]